ncbi:MAG: DUF4352 domain-containing protein [Chloroflexia bacterium]|nr:DUF4352 domain-containing protein [Chloroflexia bacterium]
MAGSGTSGIAWSRSLRGGAVALVLALALFAAPLAGGALAQADDPRLGDAVPYFGPEGDEVATVAVEEIVDPFRTYNSNSPPERGNHFVLVRIAVENTGGRVLQIDPAALALQDTLGFLSFPQYVNRGPEATEIEPDLAYGEIAAGQTVRGVVLFQVINGADMARVVYLPSRDRLVVLADLRWETNDGPVAGEPALQPTAAPAGATLQPTVEPPAISLPDAPATGAMAIPPAATTSATAAIVYEDADLGFGLTYDGETWEASESTDGLTLSNGVSIVQVTGSAVLPTEATTCVEEVAADLALTSSRQGYALLEGEGGEPTTAGDADSAFAVYGYTGRAGEAMFEQIVCTTLPGDRGVVLLLQNGPLADLASEAAASQDLLAGLTFEE